MKFQAEDSVESLQGQLERCVRAAKDLEDENRNLQGEYEQVSSNQEGNFAFVVGTSLCHLLQ